MYLKKQQKKHVNQQMIYIKVEWLGYASKQMGSGCNNGEGRSIIQMW